jgi:beta-glucosidase
VTTFADSAQSDASASPPESGDEGLSAAPEAGADGAPSDSGSSTMAEAAADGSSPPEAGASICSSGSPLPRAAWTASLATTASDSTCGAIDGVANMFDGLLTTRWSSNRAQAASPAEWVELDLGCPQTFSELVLDGTDDPNDYPRGYAVQVSRDGTVWSPASTGVGASPLTRITFPPTTARYLKISETGSSGNFWSIDELNVCGTTASACGAGATAYPRAGWATNPGTTASDNAGALDDMFDGLLSTRWTTNRVQAASPPEWVEVDMGVSQPFSRVTLQDWDECSDYPRAYTLQVSTDNATWTQLATGSATTPLTAIAFSATTARYIKITQTGASTNYWSIDELLVIH